MAQSMAEALAKAGLIDESKAKQAEQQKAKALSQEERIRLLAAGMPESEVFGPKFAGTEVP